MGICDSRCACGANSWKITARNDFWNNVWLNLTCTVCGKQEFISANVQSYEGTNEFIQDAAKYHALGEKRYYESIDEDEPKPLNFAVRCPYCQKLMPLENIDGHVKAEHPNETTYPEWKRWIDERKAKIEAGEIPPQ